MRRCLFRFFLAIFLFYGAIGAWSFELKDGNYRFIMPDTRDDVKELVPAILAFRETFDELFAFNRDVDTYPCIVHVLENREAFDRYLSSRIGETREQYVFLKYARPELSELILYPTPGKTGFAAFAGPSLNRQLFLQYLYSFVLEPPLWLRDGYQAWAERLSWNSTTGKVEIARYSPWLESAKERRSNENERLSVEDILSATTGSYESARMYPQSWAFVAFLSQAENPAYQRFLHETFVVMEGSGKYNEESQQGNTDTIRKRFRRHVTYERAEKDFSEWLLSQETYADMVQSGVAEYNAGNHAAAATKLTQALEIRPDDSVLPYYLGLVSYATGEYVAARGWYERALSSGADLAASNWALALNALAARDYASARGYLETARATNPERYGERAERYLKSLPR